MNEYPDFLNGQERENTLHIVVKHLTRQPAKGSRRLSARSISSRLTPRTFRTTRSNSGESVSVKPRALPVFSAKHAPESDKARRATRGHFSDASTSSSFGDEDDNGRRGGSRLHKDTSHPNFCSRTKTSSQNVRTRPESVSVSDSSDTSNDRRKPLPRQLPKCSPKNARLVGRRKTATAKNPELHLDLDNLSDSEEEVDAVDGTRLQVPSSHNRVRHCSDNSVGSGRRLVVTCNHETGETLIVYDFYYEWKAQSELYVARCNLCVI